MHAINSRLKSLPFFADLEPETLDAIADKGSWYSLPGGWVLFDEGDASDFLHFNLSGRLVIVRRGPDGEEVVGYVRAGDPVGEMSLLTKEAHSASVYALRDTEILSLSNSYVEDLMHDHGDFGAALSRVILARTRRPNESFHSSPPKIFAFIATSPSIDIDAQARDMAARINKYGVRAVMLPVSETVPESRSFDELEGAYDVVLLAARVQAGAWYKFILRHADRFIVFARRDAKPPRPFPMTTEAGERARKFRLVDLVMLYEGEPACPVTDWIDAIGANRVLSCRGVSCRERIARIIAGKSIGLVLSGGGARAYAHIGVIKALHEIRAPIDFICGASMGGVIAACVAMGWPVDEIEARVRRSFVESNPLGDHVLPVVALTRGRRVEDRLLNNFDDALIEELPTPFFCVSSNIVSGEPKVHRRGLLRHALRASIALPGILPPVVNGEELLVDGAVINNFPTDIMAGMHRGVTIGVDVARRGAIEIEQFRDPPDFFAWIATNGFNAAPPIFSLLMRAATARHERTAKMHPADIMITPEVLDVELRAWKKYDAAVVDGYEAAQVVLEDNWPTLGPIIEANEV